MDLFDHTFRQRHLLFYQIPYKIKSIFMPNRLHMIFEWFLINRKATQNKICLPQCQRVAFNRIGVIRILYHKFFCKTLYFAFCQWPSGV